MSLRPWFLGAFLLIGLGFDGYLLSQERITETERQVRHSLEKADPLIDLVYNKPGREGNFKRMGLEGDSLKLALKRTIDMDSDERRARLGTFLAEIGDPDRLADAICGNGKVPARYAAMAYLVKDERGQRDALAVDRASRLDREAWALVSPISAVYAELEMGKEREANATVMGVAAILLAREQDAIERNDPWGKGFGSRWSWDKVKKLHPGIEARVIEYLALFHLVMEVAMEENGFCED